MKYLELTLGVFMRNKNGNACTVYGAGVELLKSLICI